MTDSVSVQVALRVRPLVDNEIIKGCQLCLECIRNEPQVVVIGTDKAFTFNYVFGPDHDNSCLYDTAVKDLVKRLFKGYNVTILAYGQTGSGKTFSMGTSYSGDENLGVIPSAVRDIFKNVEESSDMDFKITVSFMELYQEQLFDLLASSKTVVDIREDNRTGIIVPGLTEVNVFSFEETTKCLMHGSSGRATGATAMNAQSSRSHAIFTVTIHQKSKIDESNSTTAKFHLVDLAGSERPKKTKATGERFKEGININRGLFALGNVISALGDESQKGYISYRDSKLTRLLQDSLGGNSLTLMIACVSPADYNLDETLSTLRYADRARKIKNKPIVNQDPTIAVIAKLKQELYEAKLELVNGNGGIQCPVEHKSLQIENSGLVSKIRKMTEALNDAFHENTNLMERALLAEAARDRMKVKLCELQAEYGNTMENLNQTLDHNTCPAEFWEQLKHLKELQEKIRELQAEQKRSAEEILNHELTAEHDDRKDNPPTNSGDDSSKCLLEVDIDERHEAHALQQVELNRELKELNRALALKEELAAQLALNSNQMVSIKTDYENTMKDLESQVQSLQKEKEELLRSLHEVKSPVAPKEGEQHRAHSTRLVDLEQKIAGLQKKISEQNKMIKIKEKAELKIQQLNSEITSMKQTKVKLIKHMKVESEQFRNWKVQRERELCKLRDQDQKRQNQIVRMERLHSKQQNVWKRKVEEAIATNKRLKDALARQKSVQERRGNMSVTAKVQTWVAQELEVMYSILEAEKTLEHLMEDRAMLNEQLTTLKNNILEGDVDDEKQQSMEEEIKQLAEDVSLRNTQIADMQQKILESDQEAKSKTRFDGIQSITEAKCALKYLFDCTVDMKRDKNYSENKLEELQMECSSKNSVIKELRELNSSHKQEIIQLEKEFEERLFVVYKNVSNSGSNSGLLEQICEKQGKRIEELEKLLLQKQSRKTVTLKPEKAVPIALDYSFNNETDEDDEDDSSKDPDWQKTPVFRRIQTIKTRKSNVEHIGDFNSVKRSSDGKSKCTCKSECSSKRCSCRKADAFCSSHCKCSQDCINKCDGSNENDNVDNDENVPNNFKKPRKLKVLNSSGELSF